MRIALLADIHGNSLALDAVLTDLCGRGQVDRIVNLGDCVSGPLWPRETMLRLASLDATTIRGNHDRHVATVPFAAMIASDRFAHDTLLAEQRDWLGALPPTAWIAPTILACHGTPTQDEVSLLETIHDGGLIRDRPSRIAEKLGSMETARIVLCAHSHRPDVLQLPRGPLIVNPGSVGCPAYADDEPVHVSETGTPHARYAILDVPESGGQPTVVFIAVPYAHEEAARRADANGRPDWAHALRTGLMAA